MRKISKKIARVVANSNEACYNNYKMCLASRTTHKHTFLMQRKTEMIDVAKIDNNFKIETSIKKQGIRFYSIDNPPFCIHGVFKEDGMYRRMPQEVAKKVSDGVFSLHTHTAGGRIRFKTDSPFIALKAEYWLNHNFLLPVLPIANFNIIVIIKIL